ncbi:hypothetical protein GFY24_29755 [Nocardia sp. SYP-A9097]|uniref:restriction endonuclease subunit S n=1 Tax=Nocardia sp. SYP-A9097 TaxID=2663237 RepID=UPI00129B1A05|nr:restriction endonuclease subunit S [Nocardia sp. SYP-A9097]MRH91577.1 hypothetical protein [Nocardia sp. SYP-A9097]
MDAESWQRVRLFDVGDWFSGGTPNTSNDAYWNGNIPWISAASMRTFSIEKSDRRLTATGAASGTRMVPPGSILFVVRGMSLNKEFRVGITRRDVAFGQDCKAIIPHDWIDSEFLANALLAYSPRILEMVETTSHGTGRLDTQRLGRLVINVPGLAEQRRIVDAVTSFDREIEALEERIDKTSVIAQAVAADLIHGHPAVRLGDVLQFKPRNGYSPQDIQAWTGVRSLGLGCLTPEGFQPRQLKNVVADVAKVERFLLSNGDLLISRANTRELVGHVGRYQSVGGICIYPDLMMRLIPDDRVCLSPYLELVLRAPYVREKIRSGAQGSNESMVKITSRLVENLAIPLASIEEQQRIIGIAEGFRAAIAGLVERVSKLRTIRKALAEDLLTGRVAVGDL